MAAPSRLLVAGIGNIPYPLTRHSVGHLIIDSLSERLGLTLAANDKLNGLYVRDVVRLDDQYVDLALLKTKPLMNLSGGPVVKALKATQFDSKSLVVIHDSVEHRPCIISHTCGGSPAGHNGVKSIIASLHGNEFHRLRVGIGRVDGDITDYVLGRLSSYEKQYWSVDGTGIDAIIRELGKINQNKGGPPANRPPRASR